MDRTSNKRRKKRRQEGGNSAPTLSIAVSSTIIENAQTAELATCLCGQMARTAAIFKIDEVVVIDEGSSSKEASTGSTTVSKAAAFLARILQYQETPQYLRKALIPMHADLKLAGLLPPLDAPHHMRATEWCSFREGVVTASDAEHGSLVDVGLDKAAYMEAAVKAGVRVTVSMGAKALPVESALCTETCYKAQLATLSDPKQELGLYWGYQTRIAGGVKMLLEECPFEGGYDLVVGTSEHGTVAAADELALPAFQHMLIVFGGPLGLEDMFAKDQTAASKAPQDSFDMYINTCAEQGSRTIRTEEAVLISLSYLQPALKKSIQQASR